MSLKHKNSYEFILKQIYGQHLYRLDWHTLTTPTFVLIDYFPSEAVAFVESTSTIRHQVFVTPTPIASYAVTIFSYQQGRI